MQFLRRANTAGQKVALTAAVGFGILMVVLHVISYTELSPIDELQHIDYLYQASRGDLVARGDLVGQDALRQEACRGLDYAWELPSCDSAQFDPAVFQEGGFNTAYGHSPVYYALTGSLARVLDGFAVFDNLVTPGRLLGGAWLATGLWLTWVIMGRFGVPAAARTVSLLLIPTFPAVLHASATITPDATALSAGGFVLLSALEFDTKGKRAWLLGVASFFAVATKATNITGVGLAVVYLFIRAYQRRGEHRIAARAATGVALLVAGAVIAALGWAIISAAIAEVPVEANPQHQRFAVDEIELGAIIGELGSVVSPVNNPYVPPVFGGPLAWAFVTLANWLLIGSAVAVAATSAKGSPRAALGGAAFWAMVVAGPAFVIVNFAFLGAFFPIPARYGLSMLPALMTCVGVLLQSRTAIVAAVGLVGASTLRLFVELIAG
jgi:hypothetical protein